MTRFFILCKRQLTQPVFLLLCLILPAACLFIRNLEQNSRSSLTVGLYTEAADSFLNAVFSDLVSDSRSIVFQIYTDKNRLIEQTARNEIDCAYDFDKILYTKLCENNYKNSVTCYVSPSTIMSELSREIIFAALFRRFGEHIAVSYIEEARLPDTEISALYQNYLNGDEVFSLNYQYLSTIEKTPDTAPASAAMPVRGFIAVLLLVSGLSGGVTWLSDRERKLPVPALSAILIPLFFMSVSSVVTLLLTKEAGNLIKELTALGIYLMMILIFVRLLLFVIKKPSVLAAVIPVLTLGSLIFCPIFISLGAVLPFFGIMQRLFLPYYYLLITL